MNTVMDIRGEDNASRVGDFFAALGLPVPGRGEYYRPVRDDGRRLVFLDRYGLVIRLTPEKAINPISNPHFLKPIFSRHAGGYRIDVQPGIDSPVSPVECSQIHSLLLRDYGVCAADDHRHNFGFVPHPEISFPILLDVDRYVVAVPGRTDIKPQAVGDMAGFRETPGWERFQDDFYAPLKRAIETALRADGSGGDGLSGFYRVAESWKAEGRLVAAWTDAGTCYRDTAACGAAYARRLPALTAA